MRIGILEVYLLVTLQAWLLTNNKKGFALKILKMIVSHETYRRVWSRKESSIELKYLVP